MKKRFIARAYIPALVFIFAFVSVLSFSIMKNTPKSFAASFQAGNIISDYVMGNYNSMSEWEIQSFLKAKGSCNNTDYSLYQYVTSLYPNTTWHWQDGHFVCLSDETFDGESAAHIIWQAAQDYKINPQVLIVLLEKEQSLITDSYPNSVQYRSATGYGCPDTAACDSQYYGFKNQVRNAAELYRWILDNGSRYYPVGWNYIQYNPDKSCGGSDVYIENRATAALYQYTPYQPNGGALAAGYGTAPCGAYGNRNFFLYFTDWFGDPTVTKDPEIVRFPDGDYSIHSVIDYDKVIDIDEGKTENGANVQLYEENSTEAQKWRLEYHSDSGYYSIINPTSGKALDVAGAGADNGTNVQLYDYNGTCAQLWAIVKNDGGYGLQSSCSRYMVLDLNTASTQNDTNIQLWTSNNTNAQVWDFAPIEKIEDGTYQITSKLDENKNIDIAGGSTANGANIQLWDQNGTWAQRWQIKSVGNGYYSVINPTSGKALDVAGAGVENGTNIQLYDYNGTCAQLWKIMKKDNSYIFISACSGKAMDLSNANTKNGSNIWLYGYNDTNAQIWSLKKDNPKVVDEDVYEIISNVGFNKALDVSGAGTENGTNIQLWDQNGTQAQKWRLEYHSDSGYYSIINPTSGKALDVAGAGADNGTNVQLYDYNGTCAQLWAIVKNNDKHTLISSCSGKALDVSGAETNNGTNIQIYEGNNTEAQKWYFRKAQR